MWKKVTAAKCCECQDFFALCGFAEEFGKRIFVIGEREMS
jgi:hypothetical protein